MALTIDTQSLAQHAQRVELPTRDTPEIGGGAEPAQGPSFGERLGEAVQQANDIQQEAHDLSEAYARGDNNDLHGTMIAMEKSDISLRMVANIRNRVIEAYREVMRMGA